MLDILPCRGPEAFHKFIQALKDTENGFIVRDKLCDPGSDQTEEEFIRQSKVDKLPAGTVHDILFKE